MTLANTDLTTIDTTIGALSDALINKVSPQVTSSNPVVLSPKNVRDIARAWYQKWPELEDANKSGNFSIAGNMNSWRKHYKPSLTSNSIVTKDQIFAVIKKVLTEYDLRQNPCGLTLSASLNGLEATFSWVRTGGNPFVSFVWDFGDNETSTDANPVHAYMESGEYIVSCVVTDADNEVGEAEYILIIG